MQEDFQSAANFHTLLLPLCISSACTRREGEPGERQRGCLGQTGGYVCFMVLSGQTQRVLRPPRSRNKQPDLHTRGRDRVGMARLNMS